MIQIACIAGLLGGLAVLLIGLLTPRKYCPNCNYKLPRFRKPGSGQQSMHGGWTCPNCSADIDRSGKLVAAGGSHAGPAAQVTPGTTRQCPRCAETIQIDALVCKHCGQEFGEADILAARQQAEQKAQEARQAAQAQAAEAQQARKVKSRQNSGLVFLISGGLLAFVGAILAIIFIFYAFSAQAAEAARSGGLFAAIVPVLCTLPVLALGVWLILLGRKRRKQLTE